MKDFFISYTSVDVRWAEWVASALEQAGSSVVLEAWDARPGSDFMLDMNRALEGAERILIILSPAYVESKAGKAPWVTGLASPRGVRPTFIPVRVEECSPVGELGSIKWLDLVETEGEESAREKLLEGLSHLKGSSRQLANPAKKPFSPGAVSPRSEAPESRRSTSGQALASTKRVVRFFISYARADKTLVDALVKELNTHFASSARYELLAWSDRDILVGERWSASIQEALKNCDFGLLLISPAFLASQFIGGKELPHFVAARDNPRLKPIIPVGLVPVVFDMHDLKGLEEHQFFLFKTERIEGRYYDQISGGSKRREFARQLYVAIEKRLDAYFSQFPQSALGSAAFSARSASKTRFAAKPMSAEQSAEFLTPEVADAQRGDAYRDAPRKMPKKTETIHLWQEYMRDRIPPFFGLEFSEAIWNTGFVAPTESRVVFLLVTLEKGAMVESFKYADHFLSPTRFQWQSQNRTAQDGKHGRLLRHHVKDKVAVHLFIRDKRTRAGLGAPFVYCGPVRFESWEGEKPITIVWQLEEPVPKELRALWNVPERA